jgi:hypothetical protein
MHLFESQYTSLGFERAGLFKAIAKTYRSRDVLYPGCSVHITPSLYFPHVVYVDQSESAAGFFADEKAIWEFVHRNKHYKQSAYFRFLRGDYSQPLPLREGSFDLLLALFAGGVSASCSRYVRIGGYLLTNNHQADARDAVQSADLRLAATIVHRKQAYVVSEELNTQDIARSIRKNTYLKQGDQGIVYVDNETYYVFQRIQ